MRVRVGLGRTMSVASGKGWQVGGGDHVDLRAIVTLAGGVGVVGDFNGNGVLDANDIDQLSADVRAGTNTAKFDVTGDLLVTQADREMWIHSLANTYVGD